MFSLLCIWNQWAIECHTLQILHNSCICYPAKMLSWCFKALSPLLQKTCTHNWDYKCKDIFCTKFQILKAMYRNWENMLSWTKHFKVLCSLKTDCEISLKNHLCKCLVARTLAEIVLNAMGREKADAASPYLALSCTIKQ